VKREKLNLGEKVAVICEGGAETAIMEMLLDAGRLIFTEEDLFYDEHSIQMYDHVSDVRKGEYTLLDLLKD
jgi:hypothetical protein